MGHRRDEYHERLVEHLQGREWTQEDIDRMVYNIGHSALRSSQGVLEVLEEQQQVDERIAAEAAFDEWACPPAEA